MTKATKVKAAKTPPPEEQDAPLLSISSLSKRTAHIDVDFGKGKETLFFVNLDAIGLRTRTLIADLLTETFDLGGRSLEKRFTQKDEALYDKKLRELTLLILPELTKAKMSDGKTEGKGLGTGHLSDIAVAFFVASGESVPNKVELTKRMTKLVDSLPNPTGVGSSQGSRGSTSRRLRRMRG